MLSYPIDEAKELLASKLAAAKQSLTNCEEDLDFLREQITVSIHGSRHTSANVSDDVLDYGGSYSTSL
jgi:Prefoldin subunit